MIGAAIQGGLTWLLPSFLLETLQLGPTLGSLGELWGNIVFILLVFFPAFYGGGLLIAYFSPGNTIKEPAIAATVAILFNQIYTHTREGAVVNVTGIVISVVLAYAFALAGAKLGEKLQGETTDKMRERGELGG